ncbi:MAG: hypothetical protein ACRD1X_00155 [Vicinamibacteria bacterium]
MLRSKALILLISPLTLQLVACGGGPERTLLRTFFTALQSKDNATVASMSAVGFEGTVQGWEFVSSSEETVRPFRLGELQKAEEAAKTTRDEHWEEFGAFQDEHFEDVQAIQERVEAEPDYKFTGRRGEIQAEWDRWREERSGHEAALREASAAVEKERTQASMSVMGSTTLTGFSGEVAAREVTVNVTTAEEGQKPYKFTLTKYNLVAGQNNPASRWIITSIEPAGGGTT